MQIAMNDRGKPLYKKWRATSTDIVDGLGITPSPGPRYGMLRGQWNITHLDSGYTVLPVHNIPHKICKVILHAIKELEIDWSLTVEDLRSQYYNQITEAYGIARSIVDENQ